VALTEDRLAFLGADTEMGVLTRAFDWSATPLGPAEDWPVSLKTVVGMMLATRQPACMAWGPELTFLYNDAYLPFLAARHPGALGAPFKQVWAEIWLDLTPLVETALSGEATWVEDLHLVMTRRGYAEDTWWSFSYSPLRDDDGRVAGLLDLCADTTDKVLSLRRAAAMEELSELTAHTRDPNEVQRLAAGLLGRALGVARVSYGEVEADGGRVVAARDWTTDQVETLTGETSDFNNFGAEIGPTLHRGETLRIDDVMTDPRTAAHADAYRGLNVQAVVAVPLVRQGRLRATLALHEPGPRRWTGHDLALAEAVAARTWDAVERARAEQALQGLNETLEARVVDRTAELQDA